MTRPNRRPESIKNFSSASHSSELIRSGVVDWIAVRSFLSGIVRDRLGSRLKQKMDESDIVQQSMADVHISRTNYANSSQKLTRAWLRQIAEHNLIDLHRKFVVAARRDVKREEAFFGEQDRIADPNALTASATISKCELDHALLAAMAKLTSDQQTLLRLRHQNNWTFEQIGISMSISEQCARKRWNRIVLILRNGLTDCAE